MLMDHIILCN